MATDRLLAGPTSTVARPDRNRAASRRCAWEAPRKLTHDLVAESNYSVRVPPGCAQTKRHIPMARRDEWNALADEDRNDLDVELIDLARVEERGDQPSAAHHPDLFAGGRPQALGERVDRLRNEF